jgi:Zn-dependent alcohol dehydrogenase
VSELLTPYCRGVNAGSRLDLEDLSSAVTAAHLTFDDIIDTTYPFEEAKDALEFLWEGRQVGKVVITI